MVKIVKKTQPKEKTSKEVFKPRLVNYYQDEGGNRATLLVKKGRGYFHAVQIQDAGVVAVRIHLEDEARFRNLPGSVARAARSFRGAGKRLGIQKTAKRLLKGL